MRAALRLPAAARAAVLVAVLALVSACSSSGGPAPTSTVPTPLPTSGGRVDLLCGFVPRASVVTALGRSDFTVTGDVTQAASPNPDGTKLAKASCAVSVPGGGESAAFSVQVEPVAPTDLDIVKTARSGAAAFSYPPNIGIGFASYDSYHDVAGKTYKTCESGLIRGDWTITLGIEMPAAGRSVLDDTVALAQEVIAELKLPLQPSKPYPPGFSISPS